MDVQVVDFTKCVSSIKAMNKKTQQQLLKICLALSKQKSSGFTLIELLVSIAIGWLVISALLILVVSLTRTDQQEFARTETEREMSIALDYIKSELQEAVYVYEGECINGRNDPDDSKDCPGLTNYITFPSGVNPILAFWKLEQLPYSQEDPFNANCSTNDVCKNLQLYRQSYTLVVYSLRTQSPNSNIWEGPAQLTRYQLREYTRLNQVPPQRVVTDWRNPQTSDFIHWPCDKDGLNCGGRISTYSEGNNNRNADVLIDLVDVGDEIAFSDLNPTQSGVQPCLPDYSASYSSTGGQPNTSFYACVRTPNTAFSQDIIISLRGNAIKRAGNSGGSSLPSYFPTVQTQVKTRGVRGGIPVPIKVVD